MSRWQPMASMVMTAPSIASMSRSAGMAMISLALSAILTWPSTRRWRAAKADTIWIAAFPPFLWQAPANVLPSMAITSADTPISLATQATKRRWNSAASSVAKMSPRWSCEGVPYPERQEPAKKLDLLLAEPRDIHEGFRPGKHCEQAQQQHLFERIDHLAALPRIGEICKTLQKNKRFAVRPKSRTRLHRVLRQSESEDHDRFSTSAISPKLLHPITLAHRPLQVGLMRCSL